MVRADCLEVLPTIEAGVVDSIVTDPPYGVGFKYEGHDDTPVGYEDWCRSWFAECERIAPSIFMSCGIVNVGMWARIKEFHWIAAWLKPAAMGRSPFGFCNWEPMLLWGTCQRNTVDVFTAGIIPDASLEGHSCPKPAMWGELAVQRVSAEGNTVLDPFMGSGTTSVACINTNRKYIGIEKEPKYFDLSCRRTELAWKDRCNRLPFDKPEPMKQRTFLTAE